MANYTQLSYGAQGDEVRRLQSALNTTGAGLAEDGIYGVKTQAAVRNYQQANGLAVDGIAGNETLGRLYSAGQTQTEQAAPRDTDLAWQSYLDREEFSYDPASDPLYRSYRDQYTRLGELAMEDSMGKAAALTGGYGNSYAQSVGQQAYQSYLQQLSNAIPSLYSAAYDRYLAEGEELYNRVALTEQYRQSRRQELKELMELGYHPSQAELAEAGFTRQQTNFFAGSGVSGRSGGAAGRSYDTHGYSDAQIRKLQSLAGITVDGIWGPDTQKAYQAGYRAETPESATAFLSTIYPEEHHGAVERRAYGPYKSYVLYRILASDLSQEEKDHLTYDLGVTEQDYQELVRRGLL